MKFTEEKLNEIAEQELKVADFKNETFAKTVRSGLYLWAYFAAQVEYEDEVAVRDELRNHLAEEKENYKKIENL